MTFSFFHQQHAATPFCTSAIPKVPMSLSHQTTFLKKIPMTTAFERSTGNVTCMRDVLLAQTTRIAIVPPRKRMLASDSFTGQ
jgi:hypothetical protein